MKIEEIAKWIHNNYEILAVHNNWDTNKSCKVEFEDLPETNKKTMIMLANMINSKFIEKEDLKNWAMHQNIGDDFEDWIRKEEVYRYLEII